MKHYIKYRKTSLLIVLLVIFSVLSIVTSLNIIKANEQIMLDELFSTFGRYTVSIEDEHSIKQIDNLKNDVHVKNVYPIFSNKFELENKSYSLYYSNKDVFSYLGAELIDGKYPSCANEIAVERSYLFELGFSTENMIGSKVTIPIDGKTSEREYVITGVIQFNHSNSNNQNEINFLLFNENKNYNNLLLEVSDLENYETILDNITEKYDIDKNKCYVNFDLFSALGIPTGENVLKSNTYYYIFIFIMIMLCTIITLYNIIKVFLKDISKDIATINLIGVSKKTIILSFLFYLILIICVGILLGCLVSFLLAIPFTNFFLTEELSFQNITQGFKFDLLITSLILYLLLTFLLAIPIIVRMQNISAMNLLRTSVSYGSNITKSSRHLFAPKKQFWRTKITFRNISLHKINILLNTVAIGFCISVLVIGMFFVELNIQSFGYSTDFDYKIEFDFDGDYEKQKTFFDNICNRQGINVFPEYVTEIQVNVPKECLSQKHIDYLGKNASDDLTFDYTFNNSLNIDVVVLGYNDQQLQELCELNNIDNIILENNDAVILNKTIPLRGKEGFNINIKAGDNIKINSYVNENANCKSLSVRETVDKLAVYPNGIYNKACIIIKDDLFKEFTEDYFPRTLYLNIDENNTNVVEKEITGNDFYTLTIPREQEAYIIRSNNILSRIVILFFVLILLTVGVSLFSSLYIRIYLLQNEYISYKCLGINNFNLAKIIVMEILFIFAIGAFASLIFSLISTFYMQNMLLGDIGRYLYAFPTGLFFTSLIVSFAIMCIGTIPILKQIYKINVITHLKNTT